MTAVTKTTRRAPSVESKLNRLRKKLDQSVPWATRFERNLQKLLEAQAAATRAECMGEHAYTLRSAESWLDELKKEFVSNYDDRSGAR